MNELDLTKEQYVEYSAIKNMLLTLAVLRSANEFKILELLTGYLFTEEEAGDIRRLIEETKKPD